VSHHPADRLTALLPPDAIRELLSRMDEARRRGHGRIRVVLDLKAGRWAV